MIRICTIIIAFLLCGSIDSQTYNGSIIRVIDGDTYVFQTKGGSFTVRMQGIDAPEKDQPFSKESTLFLQQYLNKEAIFKRTGTDRYGRTLGTLYIDSIDINLLSTKSGCAWHYKRYSTESKYAEAEEYARNNKIGLWGLDNPIPPWEWRKRPPSSIE